MRTARFGAKASSVIGIGALAAVLLGLSGCAQPPTPISPASTPAAREVPSPFEATNPPLPPADRRVQESPLDEAERFSRLNLARLSQVPTDPQFNGYQELAQLKARQGGLLALHRLRLEKGPNAFGAEIRKWLEKETSPLGEDIADIKKALGKPTVTAILKIPETGPVEVPYSFEFEKVESALGTLPFVYEQFSKPDDRLHGYLFALDIGRKLAFNAAVWDHYRPALELEESALIHITALIRDRSTTSELARAAIPRLQGQVGGPQEMLPLLDNGYLIATRLLQKEVTSAEDLGVEQTGLAVRYLKAREAYLLERPPESGFRLPGDLPQTAGSKWAVKQPDFLEFLGRSRRVATQLAAVELIASLEAHRLEKGGYPEKLDLLVPGYLTRIPADDLSKSGLFTYQSDGKKYRLSSQPTGKGAEEIVW